MSKLEPLVSCFEFKLEKVNSAETSEQMSGVYVSVRLKTWESEV
jgi:hypothetical protein